MAVDDENDNIKRKRRLEEIKLKQGRKTSRKRDLMLLESHQTIAHILAVCYSQIRFISDLSENNSLTILTSSCLCKRFNTLSRQEYRNYVLL